MGLLEEPTDSVRSKQILACNLILSLLGSSQAKDELKFVDLAAIFKTIRNSVLSGVTPRSLVNICARSVFRKILHPLSSEYFTVTSINP
jgi:hypothetical protein